MIKIEIHDVHQGNTDVIEFILKLLANLGVYNTSIMVIPNYEPIKESDDKYLDIIDFRKWLIEQSTGKYKAKLYCHGWKHRADMNLSRSLIGKIICKMTNNEAEFAGLDPELNLQILSQVIHECDSLGDHQLRCYGFVAPTWHAPSFLVKQALDLGFESVGTRFCWYSGNSSNIKRHCSIPLSMFSETEHDLKKSLFWSSKICKLFTKKRVRLVLHPIDFNSPAKVKLMQEFLTSMIKND